MNLSDDDVVELAAALQRHGVNLPDDQVASLDGYRQVLWRWNENLNLTRHTTIDKFAGRDVVDAMALEQYLEPGARVLDVGTGGGVPGIILAIVRPDLEMTLSESVAKRAKAVEEIAGTVAAEMRVVYGRAEDLLGTERFDTLVARAVAPLHKILRWFEPHWDAIGELLLIKGPAWIDERHEAREAGLLRRLDLRRLETYSNADGETQSIILRVRPR